MMKTLASCKYLVIDNQASLLSQSFKAIFSNADDININVFSKLDVGLGYLSREDCNVVLVDISEYLNKSLDLVYEIRKSRPNAILIVLIDKDEKKNIENILNAGASDYLLVEELNPLLLRKTIETSIEREFLKDQMLQSDRLETIGRVTCGFSHDLNNQLMIMSMLLDKKTLEFASKGVDPCCLDEIRELTEKCQSLTRFILSYGKYHAMEAEIVDLNFFISSLVECWQRLIGKEIEICLSLEELSSEVFIDQIQFEQVILNLIINSKDAIQEKGKIEISSKNCAKGEIFFDNATSKNIETNTHGVILTIQDNGSGIDESIMHKIFRPFYTTKKRENGSGLGLTLVGEIVNQMGGIVSIKSVPNQGTKVSIFLPASQSANNFTDKHI